MNLDKQGAFPPILRSVRFRDIVLIGLVGILITAIMAGAEYKINGGQWGVPLDDAWIHFQFARNFFHHFEIAFNTHQPTPGTTSILWVILLALLGGPFGEYLLAAKLLSAFFFIASGVLVYLLGILFLKSRGAATLGGILTLVAGRFVWSGLSGMEITLFSALTLLCILILALREEGKNISTLTLGILAGLATMARPEGHLLFLCLLLFTLRSSRKNLVLFLTGYLVLALPYPLFSYAQIGHFFPNSYLSKSYGFFSLPDFLFFPTYGYIVFKDLPLLCVFIPLGLGCIYLSYRSQNLPNRAEAAGAIWGTGFVVVYSVILPHYYHYCRYLMPLLPFHVLWGLRGLLTFRNYTYRWWRKVASSHPRIGDHWGLEPSPQLKKQLNRWGAIFLIASCLPPAAVRIYYFARNVSNINHQHVDMANWLRQNISSDALIAADDVGAIGFITNNPMMDILGIISPEINEKSRGISIGTLFESKENKSDKHITELIRQNRPDYLVIHPKLYRKLINCKDKFEVVYSNELRSNTICTQATMVALKANWD